MKKVVPRSHPEAKGGDRSGASAACTYRENQAVFWRRCRRAVRGNVLVLGVVSFFTDVSSEMIYPLLPVFFTGLVPAGAAAVYIGLMDGVAESVSSLLKVFSGRLSDALGKRKPIAVCGYGISAVSRPLMALAAAGWHVIALRFCDRVGKGVRTPARDALLGDSADPAMRGLAFSFHRAMDHAGAVTGPLAAAAVLYALLGYGLWQIRSPAATAAEMHALRWLFAVALLPGLAAMAVLVGKARDVAPRSEPEDECVSAIRAGGAGRLPRRFFFYLAAVALFALGNSSDLFILFYAKTKFHLALGPIIGLWVGLHLSKIAFSLPGGICSDRYGRRRVIGAGWLVYMLVYAGLAVVEGPSMFWALIILYGVYYGMTEGSERALVADLVPCEHLGKAFGLYHGVLGLAALPASLLFGVFWVQLGPAVAFGIGAALAGAATLLLVLVPSKSKHEPDVK